MVKIVNLTPHAINLVGQDGTQIAVFQPSGNIARCTTTKTVVSTVAVGDTTVNVNRTVFGDVTGLPDCAPNTIFIVSTIIAQALKDVRNDLIIVDNTVRDDKGQIIGCTSFGII